MMRLGAIFLAAMMLPLSPAHAGEQEVQTTVAGLAANGHLTLVDGTSLGDGIVLMVHGTLAHGRMEVMRALQTGLAGRGVNSLAVTLTLGMDNRAGLYDCTTPHRHRHSDAVAEIAAWIDWLKAQGAGPITLLGHSRGGAQAAWYAAEKRDPAVRRVVLMAPMRWSAADDAASYRERYGKDLAPLLAQADALVTAGKASQTMTGMDFLYCPGATVTAEAFVGYYGPEPRRDTPTLLPTVDGPVLVIAAGQDQVVTGLADAVLPLADGTRIFLKVIADADHMFLDFSADEAAEAIVGFIGLP